MEILHFVQDDRGTVQEDRMRFRRTESVECLICTVIPIWGCGVLFIFVGVDISKSRLLPILGLLSDDVESVTKGKDYRFDARVGRHLVIECDYTQSLLILWQRILTHFPVPDDIVGKD